MPSRSPSSSASRVRTPVIGVTGPVGAGKSTAAAAFEALGCVRTDADALGHAALEEPEVRSAIAARFGPGFAADGGLDRRALAQVAFADQGARRFLESLVHPRVLRRIESEVADARRRRARAVVIDCALLFESGLDALCDVTVCVDAPEPLRIRRARAGRGWSEAETRERAAAQLPAAEKRARADRVIENAEGPQRLAEAVAAFLEELAPVDGRMPRGAGTEDAER